MANVLLGIHCVVPGCTSTLRRVNQWKVKPCLKPKHAGKTHAQCMCPEPYLFFKFPGEVKLQKLWLERVKRPDLEVNHLTRVCSLHFVEGRPTRRHYFPNMNLQQVEEEEDDEEDNEGMEQQAFYDEMGEEEKRGGGNVSIVPMEMLQDGMEEEHHQGEKLTISRVKFKPEAPSSVTITRVKPGGQQGCSKPQNRFISQIKGRVDPLSTGNRLFLKDKMATTGRAGNVPARTVTNSRGMSSVSNNAPRTANNRLVNVKAEETQQYDMNMLIDEGDDDEDDEDDDGDSSGLSDIGIEIQPSSASKQMKLSNESSQAKPKMIPVLAVAPKSQGTGRTSSATPVQTKRLVPVTTMATSTTQPIITSVTGASTPTSKSGQMNTSHCYVKEESVATSQAANPPPVPSSAATPAPGAPSLATYDPSKQQLQISNPVKYIQECHMRIAQLLAEKQQLESRNAELDAKVNELQKSNNDLRREIVHQAVNAARRTPQQIGSPSFNLVPTSLLEASGGSSDAKPEKGTTDQNLKPRIRYIIRRPANFPAVKK